MLGPLKAGRCVSFQTVINESYFD